jgi:hypothetical protein
MIWMTSGFLIAVLTVTPMPQSFQARVSPNAGITRVRPLGKLPGTERRHYANSAMRKAACNCQRPYLMRLAYLRRDSDVAVANPL